MLKKQLELTWLSTRDASSRWNQLPDASRVEQVERWARLIARAARTDSLDEEERERKR